VLSEVPLCRKPLARASSIFLLFFSFLDAFHFSPASSLRRRSCIDSLVLVFPPFFPFWPAPLFTFFFSFFVFPPPLFPEQPLSFPSLQHGENGFSGVLKSLVSSLLVRAAKVLSTSFLLGLVFCRFPSNYLLFQVIAGPFLSFPLDISFISVQAIHCSPA